MSKLKLAFEDKNALEQLIGEVKKERDTNFSSKWPAARAIKRMEKDALFKRFIPLMRGSDVEVDCCYVVGSIAPKIKISGRYNPRIELDYSLKENPYFGRGEFREFFGPEVHISSDKAELWVNGRRICGYMSKPIGDSLGERRWLSEKWDFIKYQCNLMTGRIPVSDPEVRMIAKYLMGG